MMQVTTIHLKADSSKNKEIIDSLSSLSGVSISTIRHKDINFPDVPEEDIGAIAGLNWVIDHDVSPSIDDQI